jgi:hypothetical protein
MSRVRTKGARHSRRRRSPGQSIPLIAIMIVVLVAMVGLSVDVGNTFQTERRAVAASNAASLAGMNAYLRRSASTTNEAIYQSIINSLRSNGVEVAGSSSAPANEQLQLEAFYLDSEGKPLSTGATPRITPNGQRAPSNVGYIQVNLKGNVDTYFARVVNRNNLPVDATSYAGSCPAGEGVYPIGINGDVLDGNRFRDPGDVNPADGVKDKGWRTVTLSGATFTAMRLEQQNGANGNGFAWLRWMSNDNSAGALEEGLTVPGTLLNGFTEAAWPDNNRPDDYPNEPGFLNIGDWVHGSTASGAGVNGRIEAQRADGVRMVLPIFSAAQGIDGSAQYRIADFGVFMVSGQGNDPATGTPFLDLIFVGRDVNQKVACSYSAAPDPTPVFNLSGAVSIRPEYGFAPTNRKPIQYVVVLDVSGSMSANFSGQCNSGPGGFPAGQNYWQCANGPVGAPQVQVVGTGPTYFWNNVNERRIRVAKDALEALVRVTNMQGNGDQYDQNRPVDQMSIVWFRNTVNRGEGNISRFANPAGPSPYFSSNPDDLRNAIRNAGNLGGDIYRTTGGTNGAAGLFRAALAYDTAPQNVTQNGRTWEYKRVVIFITDGVSNQFLNRSANNLHGGTSDENSWRAGHACRTPLAVEIATCQVTGNAQVQGGGVTPQGVSVAAGMDRPITQAGQVSRGDLQARGAEVFVVALSNIPSTGLQDTIASFPSNFASADELRRRADGSTNVDDIILKINTEVEGAACEPRSDLLDGNPEFRGTIPAGHFPQSGVNLPELGITLVYPHVGNVLLTNRENNVSYTIPIMADAQGNLKYSKSDLPRGDYRLSAYVFYKHPLDLPTAGVRMYRNLVGADSTTQEVVVPVGTGGGEVGLGKNIVWDVQLKLTGDACARPAE